MDIKLVRLGPGGQLDDAFIREGKRILRTPHEKIFVLKGNTCDLNWLKQRIEELVIFAYEQDEHGMKSKLEEIVPEYQPIGMKHSTPPTANNRSPGQSFSLSHSFQTDLEEIPPPNFPERLSITWGWGKPSVI
jgi:hypothetical protein